MTTDKSRSLLTLQRRGNLPVRRMSGDLPVLLLDVNLLCVTVILPGSGDIVIKRLVTYSHRKQVSSQQSNIQVE